MKCPPKPTRAKVKLRTSYIFFLSSSLRVRLSRILLSLSISLGLSTHSISNYFGSKVEERQEDIDVPRFQTQVSTLSNPALLRRSKTKRSRIDPALLLESMQCLHDRYFIFPKIVVISLCFIFFPYIIHINIETSFFFFHHPLWDISFYGTFHSIVHYRWLYSASNKNL